MNPMLERPAEALQDAAELNDWFESLDRVAARYGPQCVADLLQALRMRASTVAAGLPVSTSTPYANTTL